MYGKSEGDLSANNSIWLHCREIFHRDYECRNIVYFTTRRGKSVINFLKEIQDRLELKKRQRLVIEEDYNVLKITLSKFWREKFRKHLLTVLLREGRRFDKVGYKRTIDNGKYLKKTKIAFRYFMKGNVNIKINYFNGWCDTFKKKTRKEVSKLLGK